MDVAVACAEQDFANDTQSNHAKTMRWLQAQGAHPTGSKRRGQKRIDGLLARDEARAAAARQPVETVLSPKQYCTHQHIEFLNV